MMIDFEASNRAHAERMASVRAELAARHAQDVAEARERMRLPRLLTFRERWNLAWAGWTDQPVWLRVLDVVAAVLLIAAVVAAVAAYWAVMLVVGFFSFIGFGTIAARRLF